MNINLLTRPEVIQKVNPYAEKVYLKIFDGFNDYLEHDSDVSHIHDNTTKANLIRSRIINRIKELVLEFPTWQWVVKGRGIFIVIDGTIKLRFKKMCGAITKNVRTNQVDSFRAQEKSDEVISEKYINVDIAWLLNDFYSTIEEIFIVAPNGMKKNLWRVQFKPEGIEAGRSVPLFVDTPEDKEGQIDIAKVKPELKKKKRKNNNNDEAGQ